MNEKNEQYQNELVEYLMILWSVIFIAVVIGVIVNSQSTTVNREALSTASSDQIEEVGIQRMDTSEASIEKGTEPPISLTDNSAKAAVFGCVLCSIAVTLYVYLRKPHEKPQ